MFRIHIRSLQVQIQRKICIRIRSRSGSGLFFTLPEILNNFLYFYDLIKTKLWIGMTSPNPYSEYISRSRRPLYGSKMDLAPKHGSPGVPCLNSSVKTYLYSVHTYLVFYFLSRSVNGILLQHTWCKISKKFDSFQVVYFMSELILII